MPLYACVQAWDEKSAESCAAELAQHTFEGFAIGGLVPRGRDWESVRAIVRAVKKEVGERPLHIFGLGKPETTARLFEMGVDSVDSSSYVKLAADGRLWSRPDARLEDPTVTDRLNLAIRNLATATGMELPLGVLTDSGLGQRQCVLDAGRRVVTVGQT